MLCVCIYACMNELNGCMQACMHAAMQAYYIHWIHCICCIRYIRCICCIHCMCCIRCIHLSLKSFLFILFGSNHSHTNNNHVNNYGLIGIQRHIVMDIISQCICNTLASKYQMTGNGLFTWSL